MDGDLLIIYKCTFPNNKCYIGQTKRSLSERKKEHLKDAFLENDIRYNYPFYRAIRKYGVDNLIWEIIDTATNTSELSEKEKYWIKFYNSSVNFEDSNGYNLTFGGEGMNGYKHSEKSLEKISISERGENNTRAKLTNEDVLKIVELSKTIKQVELSKMFHTTEVQISRILSGLRWSSVTGIKYSR